jgi:hypothetical protein
MENKVLTKEQIESLKKRGIDPSSDKLISYRFTISVNTKRLSFFEMFYNKFLGDTTIVGKLLCCTQKTDESISFHMRKLNSNGYSNGLELKGPSKTYEEILVDGVPYTRMKFEFTNCHPFVVAKVITDLTDCVDFTSKIYGYDTDGNEILLIKYPIGTVVNIKNSGNSDIDYIVSGYNYERDINEFTYVIKRFEDGEIMGMMNISEERIKPSRGNNLDILLGLN